MKLIECPRDAIQGLEGFIPTGVKAEYINKLLQVGFDTIDFGSFVSPRWVPQLRDTAEVLGKLNLSSTKSALLAIVANLRGATDACNFDEIKYLGFPFSISETFQKRNINATLRESLGRVEDIQIVNNICAQHDKKLVVYISMAFGNPYGDPWNQAIMHEWTEKLAGLGVEIMALSDTVGVSTPELIEEVFADVIGTFPQIEFGAHFHTTADTWEGKVKAAFKAGCRRFDGAIKGYGGCPMAASNLVGNMPTENMVSMFASDGIDLGINLDIFNECLAMADAVFPKQNNSG